MRISLIDKPARSSRKRSTIGQVLTAERVDNVLVATVWLQPSVGVHTDMFHCIACRGRTAPATGAALRTLRVLQWSTGM
jgi:hypothetical protein